MKFKTSVWFERNRLHNKTTFPDEPLKTVSVSVPEQAERAAELPTEPAEGSSDRKTGGDERHRQEDIGTPGQAAQEEAAEPAAG